MLYRVAGDPKIGYDLGVGTGTYGGYARWVRTLVRVRYGGTVRGYGTGVRYWGYGTGVRYRGTVWGIQCGGPVRGVRYGGTVRGTVGNVVLFPVPYPNPLGMYTVPARDARIENLDFITLQN